MLRSVRLGARIAPLLAMFVLAGPAPVVLAQSMKENLGHMLFMDKNLSSTKTQSCQSCHNGTDGFSDPDKGFPTSEGAVAGRFGPRNAPGVAYLGSSPALHYDAARGTYVGGFFWDGRANSLTDQAKGPFLNPLEMNMADKASVVAVVQAATYSGMFKMVYGMSAFDNVDAAYNNVADAIAVWELSVTPSMVTMYSSRYDAWHAGMGTLTAQEQRGMAVFAGKGNCSSCHSMAADADNHVPFTDFSHHNMGLPKNPGNPFYAMPAEFNPDGAAYIDRGLGAVLGDSAYDGFFKTPTLRDVLGSGPYGHNGAFATLDDVIRFMDSRNVPGAGWGPPEVGTNLDTTVGNLGLTSDEMGDIRAFLGTLTDVGVTPEPATLAILALGWLTIRTRRRRA